MADRSGQLVIQALRRATTAGTPLHGSRSQPGLFPTTPAGRQAARSAREQGLLEILDGSEDRCVLTDKGLDYLLGEIEPRHVLEDLVRILEEREQQLTQLLLEVRTLQDQLRHLTNIARVVLPLAKERCGRPFDSDIPEISGPSSALGASGKEGEAALLAHLRDWEGPGDFPLPLLFRQLVSTVPGMTLGRFHDILRRLRETQQVYLHPWTGPKYDLPEPNCALLVGHDIVYYVSLRAERPAGRKEAG